MFHLDTIEITINTPTLLFSTVSLLYIGYTNRFMSITNLVRSLKDKFLETHDEQLIRQITSLRRRVILIRNMQLLGISALICSVLSVISIYFKFQQYGELFFGIGLVLLSFSMIAAVREVLISVDALNIELSNIEELKEELEEQGLLNMGGIRRLFKQDDDRES
jgi:Protein of unknown function (DUF2721)